MKLTAAKNISFVKNNFTYLFNFINLSFVQVSNILIQVFLFSLIARKIGLQHFGYVMVANAYATLAGIFINYGTNQSGIKDVALNKSVPKLLSQIFFSVYYTRLILFIVSLLVLLVLYLLGFHNWIYLAFALPLILAEVFNPLFFFIGIEKLLLYNVVNLISKAIAGLLIVSFINTTADSHYVNFYLGIGSVLMYIVLIVYGIRKYNIAIFPFSFISSFQFLQQNFYLVCNSLSVQLQQSVFLFAIASTKNDLIVGAYSLCDKIIWVFRLFIISFSSIIFPKAAVLQKENEPKWKKYKFNINLAFCFVFIAAGIILFSFSPFIIKMVTGKQDALSELYLRAVAFVPLITALNSLNVLDLLMKNKYNFIFIIAVMLLGLASILSFAFIRFNNPNLFGYYLIVIESFGLILYTLFLRSAERKLNPL
jgi:O-antigen/teichoic acid export membrane protein